MNLAIESEDGENTVGGIISDKKTTNKWSIGKPKTAEGKKEKEEEKEKEKKKEKEKEEGKEKEEVQEHGTKLDAPPVGLFETVGSGLNREVTRFPSIFWEKKFLITKMLRKFLKCFFTHKERALIWRNCLHKIFIRQN